MFVVLLKFSENKTQASQLMDGHKRLLKSPRRKPMNVCDFFLVKPS